MGIFATFKRAVNYFKSTAESPRKELWWDITPRTTFANIKDFSESLVEMNVSSICLMTGKSNDNDPFSYWSLGDIERLINYFRDNQINVDIGITLWARPTEQWLTALKSLIINPSNAPVLSRLSYFEFDIEGNWKASEAGDYWQTANLDLIAIGLLLKRQFPNIKVGSTIHLGRLNLGASPYFDYVAVQGYSISKYQNLDGLHPSTMHLTVMDRFNKIKVLNSRIELLYGLAAYSQDGFNNLTAKQAMEIAYNNAKKKAKTIRWWSAKHVLNNKERINYIRDFN